MGGVYRRRVLSIDGGRSMKDKKLHDAIEAQGGRAYVASVIGRTAGHISHCENGRNEWPLAERFVIETGRVEDMDIWQIERGASDD